MAMAATVKLVLGSIAFAIFWVLAVFPAVPFLPIGRTAGSLLGAMLMVLFQVMTPDQAYAAIDLPILGLLFGTMVVSVFLERADMFKYIGKLLSWKSKGAKDLLCRICLISAISSALFTNDTSCVVLTEFVLKMARQHNLPPHPFLLALASSANIGSSATPIGNPQNLVIAIQSKISFGRFLFGILPAMLVGVCVNALILLCMYWKVLSDQNDKDDATVEVVVGEDNAVSHQFSPAAMSHVASLNLQELNSTIESVNIRSSLNLQELNSTMESVNIRSSLNNGDTDHVGPTLENRGNLAENNSIQTSPCVSDHTGHTERIEEGVYFSGSELQNVTSSGIESTRNLDSSIEVGNYGSTPSKGSSSVNGITCHNFQEFVEGSLGISKKWKRVIWKACVYTITLGMLVSLLMGFNMSWTAITTALVLLVLDFKDARPCLEKVSYLLLIFFCGMFITIDGFDRTGLPSTLWEFVEPHAKVNQTGGIALLAAVIIVLSNLVSNVPTVLLLGARVAASAAAISPESERKAWLVLAWVSTVAGNLSLLGSAANLIVCEQARRAQQNGFNLSFWSHLKFGVPSTLIGTAVGLALVRG